MLDGTNQCKLGELISIKHGFAFASEHFGTEGPFVLLTPGNFLEGGGFRWLDEKQKFYDGPVPKDFILSPGDMLVAMTEQAPGLLGSTFFVPDGNKYLHNQRLGLIRVHASDRLHDQFLHYYLSLPEVRRIISAESAGTKVKHTSPERLYGLEVLLPPLPEQRKIAEILRTWDKALEKLTALRAAKQDWFTGLTQQIMGRGGVFPQRWPLKALSAVSTPVRRKSKGDNHPVMTISAKSGFLMQSDKFARDMAGQSVERYTLLHEGEFAYNKGNSKTAPYGCVFRLERPTALVPFVYYCFALKSGLDPEFYEHLFAAGALNHQLSRLINSGVRNDGLLNLYSDDFYSCRVPVPPIDEQRKIALALTAAKQELALIDDEIEALTRQKRGLMQKLLTGEWRVKLEAPVA